MRKGEREAVTRGREQTLREPRVGSAVHRSPYIFFGKILVLIDISRTRTRLLI